MRIDSWCLSSKFTIVFFLCKFCLSLPLDFSLKPLLYAILPVGKNENWINRGAGMKVLRNCWSSLLLKLENYSVYSEPTSPLMLECWLCELLPAVTLVFIWIILLFSFTEMEQCEQSTLPSIDPTTVPRIHSNCSDLWQGGESFPSHHRGVQSAQPVQVARCLEQPEQESTWR